MPTVFCVGRNYAAHVEEMGGRRDAPPAPVVFLKPEHAVVAPPGPIVLPDAAGEIHHEIELVVRVGEERTVAAVALGLDLTDRTRQAEAKGEGAPWAAAKGFRGSAPVGPFVSAAEAPPLDAIRFRLEVNGEVRQRGDTARMLTAVPDLLAAIDAWFGLRPGDLVFTGTPEGVGPLTSSDALVLAMDDVPEATARFAVA
jgi:2-keto-4-pentenoate hydratase/2-oxohepta-3-ene-1,7-dioic acid hydratase in catechol pathway